MSSRPREPDAAPTAAASESATPPEVPLEELFDVVKNERRRLVLAALADREGPIRIGELAEHVAARENDKPVARLGSDERKRAYVGLYQSHLPKLDALGIVRFEKNRGRVELGPNHALVEPYVGREVEHADGAAQWAWTYLTLGALAATGVVLAFLGGAPLVQAAAASAVLVLGTTSVAHCLAVPGEATST